MPIQPNHTSVLDDLIERFEDAWNACQPPTAPDVCDFFPTPASEDYLRTVVELLRVDMERRWSSDQRKTIDDYRKEFPSLADERLLLEALAFEEFRLRSEGNEAVRPESYAKKYGINTSEWPSTSDHDTQALRMWNESTLDMLADESDRLVSTAVDYPEIGDTFCEFTVRELLGEGKFSRVYLAHQDELADRPVVLKVSPELLHESDKLARLQHTHIVPIYSLHRQDSLHAICMPFFGRTTLEDTLRISRDAERSREGSNSPHQPMFGREEDCCTLIAKLADALHHAHERSIVHRDLKPANVLIGDDGEPFILDFNLSESLVVGGPVSLFVGGTLPYMAPEHLEAVLSHARLDQRCDVYSLGVILYRMVSGQLPFPRQEGNFVEAVTRMIKDRRQIAAWRERLADRCSPDMASIVEKCLQPDAEERYESAADLAEDLQRHAKDQSLRHARNRSIAQRGRKWWRRHRHLASIGSVLAAAAVLLSISIGIAAWRGHQNQVLMATANAASFHDEFVDLRLPLTPLGEAAATLRQEAVDRIKQSIRRFGAANDPNWQQSSAIRLLSPEDRLRTVQEIGELCFLMASRNHATLDANTAEHTEYAGIAAACLWMPISPGVELRSTDDWQFSAEDSKLSPAQQLRLKAVQKTTQKRYSAALPLLEQAIEYQPNDPLLWLLIGLVQRETDDLSLSELSLTRCIALAPSSPFGYFQRGVTRLAQEQFAEAADDFSTVLVLRPATPEAHFNRANAGKGEKQFDQALRDCNRAMELGWTGCRTYLLRSEIYVLLGDVEAAAADRRRGISQTPQDAAGWCERGMAQVNDDHDAAIADFEMAVELNPRCRDAMQNLAHIYAEVLGQNEEALKWMERVEATYPDYATAAASKAVLLARLSRDEEAGRCIDRALELSHSAETYYLVASAYAQMAARAPELADQAVDALRACLNQDRSWFGRVIYDVDFTPIKTNPNLNKILAACNVMVNGESANEVK